mgnify:CR=1 FL=1
MWYWLGFLLSHMLDPIIIGAALVLYLFSLKVNVKLRFLLAIGVAILLGLLASIFHELATGEEGVRQFLSFIGSSTAFLIVFSILHFAGMLVRKYKMGNDF